jgi:hypothetical protein
MRCEIMDTKMIERDETQESQLNAHRLSILKLGRPDETPYGNNT